jgi:hypothetical protein
LTVYSILTFSNPLLLWGLLALAIPVIIHLFNFRRVKKIQFSNIALLKRVKEETSSKRKPVELLILASRLLFIAFLIFAFAQPIFKDKSNTLELSDQALIYLDNSMSMDMPVNNQQSAFDVAFSLATGVVGAYPESAKFKFLENGYGNSLNTSYTAATMKDRFTEMQLSGIGRSPAEIQSRIAASAFRGDVYLISDFQKNEEIDLDPIVNDTTRNYYLLPVESEISSNLYFDTAYLANSFLLGAMKNELKVIVRNEGTEDFENVNLRLFYNDQLASTAQIDVSANGIQEYTFEIDPKASGLDNVKISLDDSKVLFDNEFNLTLNNIEKVSVHEVTGAKSSPYIKQLFGENELFNYQSFDINNLDNNQLVLGDIIILNQLTTFSNQLIASLNNVLEMNGTVLIIPSSKGAVQMYSQLGLNVRNDSEERLALAQPNFQNPFFDGIFEEKNEAIAMPEASNNFRLMNSELAVLSFKNGREFLSKVDAPSGNVYFFSTDFSDNATSFPSHSLFVPIMYKLALGSKVNLSRLYYLTDEQTIIYPLDVSLSSNDILTLENDNKKITPDQRISGKSLIMEVPKDELNAGNYQLKMGDQVLGTLAFNQSKSESSVQRYSVDELRTLAQADHIYVINASEAIDVDRELTSGIKGIELWKYALMLSLLFLFAEIILIRYL